MKQLGRSFIRMSTKFSGINRIEQISLLYTHYTSVIQLRYMQNSFNEIKALKRKNQLFMRIKVQLNFYIHTVKFNLSSQYIRIYGNSIIPFKTLYIINIIFTTEIVDVSFNHGPDDKLKRSFWPEKRNMLKYLSLE